VGEGAPFLIQRFPSYPPRLNWLGTSGRVGPDEGGVPPGGSLLFCMFIANSSCGTLTISIAHTLPGIRGFSQGDPTLSARDPPPPPFTGWQGSSGWVGPAKERDPPFHCYYPEGNPLNDPPGCLFFTPFVRNEMPVSSFEPVECVARIMRGLPPRLTVGVV